MATRPALALILFVLATTLLPAQSGDSPYVIRDVRVFDGETVAERQTVVISQGKIAAVGGINIAVPAGAQEVVGERRTLLPGLMDSHIHLPFVNPADEHNRATAEQNYLWQVISKLRGYRYHADVPLMEGLTVVLVVIARDGRLLDAQVVRSSGVPAMDQGVLAGIRQGSPYAPLPESLSGSSARFRLPLVSVPEGR